MEQGLAHWSTGETCSGCSLQHAAGMQCSHIEEGRALELRPWLTPKPQLSRILTHFPAFPDITRVS